jgi:Spy/CpxP family protein refolding chaperone
MMSPSKRWLVSALILFIGTVSAVTARQSRPPSPPWWKDERIVSELHLNVKQVEKIDAIWNETAPELFEQSRALDSHEKTLSKMIKEGVSEAKVKVQIDLVESTRARRSTARQFMLYKMRMVMTPDQRLKFDTIHAKWSRDNQRQPPPGSRSSKSSQGSQGSQVSPGSGAKKPEARPATPARP